MANKYRGEINATIAGKEYLLRPTFEALVEFEDKAGTTAFEALRDFANNQRAPAKVITAAIWAGIRGATKPGDKSPSFSEVGAIVQKHGIVQCTTIVFEFLTNALSSDEEVENIKKQLGKKDGAEK